MGPLRAPKSPHWVRLPLTPKSLHCLTSPHGTFIPSNNTSEVLMLHK